MMHKKQGWTLTLYLMLLAFITKVHSIDTANESRIRLSNISCCEKCRCVDTDVLCDGVKNLTSLPLDCPANTTLLSFVGCGLSKLDDGELGKHYQKLESLNISGNRISVLRNTTFAGLKNLHVLNMAGNYYSISELDPHVFSSLHNIKYLEAGGFGDAADTRQDQIAGKAWMNTIQGLENSTIETIIFNQVSANPIVLEKSYCKYLKNSPVKNIMLRRNELVGFDLECLEYVPQIQTIDLSVNTLAMSFSFFRLFKDLFLRDTKIREIIITDNLMRQYLVTHEVFDKRWLAMIPWPFPKNIQSINFARSVLGSVSYALSYGLRVLDYNQLAQLDLSNTKVFRNIGDKVLGLVKLREIHLQNNECVISPVVFSCRRGAFESLEILDISHNYLSLPPEAEENTTKVFENCTKLQYLDISYNELEYIPSTAFNDVSGLRTLNLSGNKFDKLNIRIQHLIVLEMLNISHNKLQTIPKYIRDDLDYLKQHRKVGVKLDLTDNPLLCGCHSTDFIEWMQAYSKDIHHWDMLRCTFYNESVIQMRSVNVPILRITCIKNLILAGTIPSGILIIVMIVTIVVYWKRVRIQIIYLKFRAKFRHQGKENTGFDFDAFISYSSLDERWCQEVLYANLVGKYHYKICLDEVNFIAGNPISSVITDAIMKSNKVILILTENFLRSKWCAFELNLTNGILADRKRDCLLLILKEPVDALPQELITDTLRSILDTRIYLEWSRDDDRKDLFWQRIRDALGVPWSRVDPEQTQTGSQYIAPQRLEDETRARDFLDRHPSVNDENTPLLN